MKKFRIFALLMSICILLSLAACSTVSSDNILLKISNANTMEAIKKNNPTAGYYVEVTNHDQQTASVFTYLDQEKYIYASDGYVCVDRSGVMTDYYEDEQRHVSILFVGKTAYEEELAQWSLTWFEYDPMETVDKITKTNGQLLIDTTNIDEASLADFAEDYGCEVGTLEKIAFHYTVNAKNYEILKMSTVVHFKDGTSTTCIQLTRLENYSDYMPDTKVIQDTKDLEKRTVTLIANPGTEKEESFQFSIPKGYAYTPVFSGEYDGKIYADPECTEKLKQDLEDLTKDVVGYLKTADAE